MGSVKDEIKQGRPFRSPADETVVTLLRTADHLRTLLSGVVEAHGVTLQQYNVLRILRGAGEAGLPTLEIAGRMIEHSPGITRLLDRLEARQLVRRERCPQDRRQVLCYATAAGLRLLALVDDPLEREGARFVSPLDARRAAELVRALDTLRNPAAPAATPAPGPGRPEKSRKKEKKERKP